MPVRPSTFLRRPLQSLQNVVPSGSAQRPHSQELIWLLGPMSPSSPNPGTPSAHDRPDDARGRVHAPHPEPVLLGHVQIVPGVDEDGVGHDDAGVGGRASVTDGGSEGAAVHAHGIGIAQDRGQNAPPVDLADPVVAVVADVEVVAGIDRQMLAVIERSLQRRDPVSVVAPHADPGVAADDALSVHLPDRGRRFVGDVQIALRVLGHAGGDVQLRLRRRASIPFPAPNAAPRHGGDDAGGGIDAPDPVVPQIAQVEISVPISPEIMGGVEAGVPGGSSVPGKPLDSVTGEGVQNALAVDPPDALAVVIHDEEIPRGSRTTPMGQPASMVAASVPDRQPTPAMVAT